MSNIQIFNYMSSKEVRVIMQDGEPWFVAKDVCEILEIRDVTSALRTLDSDEKLLRKISGPDQSRDFMTIYESGLYTLIMRSNKPEAKAFRKWVTSEVLPVIRKHGFYATPKTAQEILNDPETFIEILKAYSRERDRNLELETKNIQLEAKIEEDKPKVLFAEALEVCKDSILIRDFAKLLTQNGIKVGEVRLYQWLRQKEFLCSSSASWNLPRQRYVEDGIFEIKTMLFAYPNGTQKIKHTTKVTPKGQRYFIEGFSTGRFAI